MIARFLSQDPIGFAGHQANLYEYVGNAPTNGIDPSGLFAANIVYNAFIPNTLGFKVANSPVAGVQWGWVPYQIIRTKAFATDNRATVGQAGTHRLQLSISVDTGQAGHLHGQLSSANANPSHQIRVYYANDLSGTKTYVPDSIKTDNAQIAHPLDKIYNQFIGSRRQSVVDAHASAAYPFGISG